MKPQVSLVVFVIGIAAHVVGCTASAASPSVSGDIRELIESARGAPAPLCACAARAVEFHWGGPDAPASPLGRLVGGPRRDRRSRTLTDDDVRFLLASLDTPDPCVREVAVRLVAQDDREEVAAGLVQRLTAADSSLRMTAALGLGIAPRESTVEPLIRALRDDAAGVRANAVWALGRVGDERAAGPATNALGDRSPLVREAAAEALGHLEAKTAAPSLARLLRDDRSAAVRRTSGWALVQMGAEEAGPELASALEKDPDATVREMSAWALGNLDRGRAATGVLLGAAKHDDDVDVREMAVWSIAQHDDASMAQGLGEIIGSDHNACVRSTTAWALGQLGLRSAPKGLIAALGDRDRELRLAAAWALGEIEDESALPALRAALASETYDDARRAELRALIHSGEQPALLKSLLESKDPEVRKTAIRGIAGDHGLDPWPWPQPRPRPFPD